MLAAVLGQLSTTAAHNAQSLKTCLATLDLLSFRIARLRSLSDQLKLSTVPFETFVACHLAFRQALSGIGELASLPISRA